MGMFGGLLTAGYGKARTLGLKFRQMTGKIALLESRERQDIKNAAIDILDEYKLSREKMQLLADLFL
ncbi:MAG: hypothetical protein QXH80_02960 [Candidatus Nanoarchaeia archaeon]